MAAFPTYPFRIVGIGASAGGLEALTALVANISTTSGMAYIVLQHTVPDVPSLLASLPARAANVKVVEAEHKMGVEPNVVYVAPSKFSIELRRSLNL
jgi:two-component system CheB/CheR fusion protein